MPATLLTARLALRLVAPEDAEALFPHFNNWNVVRWLTGPAWPVDKANLRAFFARCARERAAVEELRVIEHLGQPMGAIGWGYRDGAFAAETGPNLGYWLGEAFWGRGFMSEAVAAIVEHVFADVTVPAIRSGVIEGNTASLQIQRKLGFVDLARKMSFSRPLQREVPALDTVLVRPGSRLVFGSEAR